MNLIIFGLWPNWRPQFLIIFHNMNFQQLNKSTALERYLMSKTGFKKTNGVFPYLVQGKNENQELIEFPCLGHHVVTR